MFEKQKGESLQWKKVNISYLVTFKVLLSLVCNKALPIIPKVAQVLPHNMLINHVKILILNLNQNQKSIFMNHVVNAQNLSIYYNKGSSNGCYKLMITFRTIIIVPKVHPNNLKRTLHNNNKYINNLVRWISMMKPIQSSIPSYYNKTQSQYSSSLVQVC